mgnify:CR=1 FL=1
MKNILLPIISAIIAVALLGACKTNEANYRAAYEQAKDKNTDTGDSLSTQGLRDFNRPKAMVIGGDTLMVRTERVVVSKDAGVAEAALKKYCVVVAQFRQIFNARSMCQRLIDGGYPGAFVVNNREGQYYVVASATDSSSEAAAMIRDITADKSVVLREPYPYVLRPGQLVR